MRLASSPGKRRKNSATGMLAFLLVLFNMPEYTNFAVCKGDTPESKSGFCEESNFSLSDLNRLPLQSLLCLSSFECLVYATARIQSHAASSFHQHPLVRCSGGRRLGEPGRPRGAGNAMSDLLVSDLRLCAPQRANAFRRPGPDTGFLRAAPGKEILQAGRSRTGTLPSFSAHRSGPIPSERLAQGQCREARCRSVPRFARSARCRRPLSG